MPWIAALLTVVCQTGDREGEETPSGRRNRELQLGDLVAGGQPALNGLGGDGSREDDDVHRHHVRFPMYAPLLRGSDDSSCQ
jgi:hypothetical protein